MPGRQRTSAEPGRCRCRRYRRARPSRPAAVLDLLAVEAPTDVSRPLALPLDDDLGRVGDLFFSVPRVDGRVVASDRSGNLVQQVLGDVLTRLAECVRDRTDRTRCGLAPPSASCSAARSSSRVSTSGPPQPLMNRSEWHEVETRELLLAAEQEADGGAEPQRVLSVRSRTRTPQGASGRRQGLAERDCRNGRSLLLDHPPAGRCRSDHRLSRRSSSSGSARGRPISVGASTARRSRIRGGSTRTGTSIPSASASSWLCGGSLPTGHAVRSFSCSMTLSRWISIARVTSFGSCETSSRTTRSSCSRTTSYSPTGAPGWRPACGVS